MLPYRLPSAALLARRLRAPWPEPGEAPPALRAIAVDGEPSSLEWLQIAFGAVPGVELIGTTRSGATALEMIREMRPDLVLLDAAMPELSGVVAAVRSGPASKPAILLMAAGVGDVAVALARGVDHILKPVSIADLGRALERVQQRKLLDERDAEIAEMQRIIAALREGPATVAAAPRPYVGEFWGFRQNELVRVPVDELVWAEAERDYVRLHLRAGSCLLRGRISVIAARLDPALFIRVHRSAVVRAAEVVAVARATTGVLVARLAGGAEVNVGRSYARSIASLQAKVRRPIAVDTCAAMETSLVVSNDRAEES